MENGSSNLFYFFFSDLQFNNCRKGNCSKRE